jgi:hypothetical protein
LRKKELVFKIKSMILSGTAKIKANGKELVVTVKNGYPVKAFI